MAPSLEITFPRDGDVLNRHDGRETASALTVTVRGTAPAGATVMVNGAPAEVSGPSFTSEVELGRRENWITAQAGDSSHAIEVFWNRGSRKRYRFSVDDNIEFLKDLAAEPSAYPSLFDHWYLRFVREMHEEYGTKVHLNIYYQTQGFDLTEMPDRWRTEWEANAGWLHLSFHALQDQPDRPYRNARYAQIAHDYDLVCAEIQRFAGPEVTGNTTTTHWAEIPRDGVAALRDRGIENLVALYHVMGYAGKCTTGYYLNPEQCAYCDGRGAWHDRGAGLTFIRCAAVVNSLEVAAIPPFLEERTATPATEDMLELLIHEQYFRKELHYYQPTILEKVRTAIRWANDHGYEPVFWSEGFLGTP